MRTHCLKITAIIGFTLLVLTGRPGVAHAQPWTTVNPPPAGVFLQTCVLLTDGRVMCHQMLTNAWHILTPDINGSYVNGAWTLTTPMPMGSDTSNVDTDGDGIPDSTCAPCPYTPRFHYTGVMADGQVVVVGGEDNSNGRSWTNIGFMYNPVADTWSAQLTVPFPAGTVGDASGIILDNGTLLLAQGAGPFTNLASFNQGTLNFTALNPTGKAGQNNEENWNILPDGTVLTIASRIASRFEIYDPVANNWTSPLPLPNMPVNLADTGTTFNTAEIGPCVLRPDGTLICFSGNELGQNALYDTATNTWTNTAAMDFPVIGGISDSVADGQASLLPDGNVLVMASPVTDLNCMFNPPVCGVFNPPSNFYEFDLATNTLMGVPNSPNALSFRAFNARMLLLPTGEVLLTAYNQNATQDVEVYSNGGQPQDAWRPVITAAPGYVVPGDTYPISGTLFNGFSEGATYGDDAAMSTNYPLVRITNQATGNVFYARTHDHTDDATGNPSMGVDLVGSTRVATTQVDMPSGLDSGASELVVVVNGIPSEPVIINGVEKTIISGPDKNTDGKIDLAVEVGTQNPVAYDFKLSYTLQTSADVVIKDTVPAEWDVVLMDDTLGCFAASANGKNNGKSATKITCNEPNPVNGMVTVWVETRCHGNNNNTKCRPTSCGALYLNDSAAVFEVDGLGEIIDPLNPISTSNSLCIAAVKDLNGGGIDYTGDGDEDGDGLTDYEEACVIGSDPCDASSP